MKIIKISVNNFAQISANLVTEKITLLQRELKRPINIILATGKTMINFLDQLSQSSTNWSLTNFFHLDEYKSLSPQNPSSFAYFLTQNLFSKINIPKKNINFINGESPDLLSYVNKLHSLGGADIIMLGIGLNGHLAFNEPSSDYNFSSRISEVKLHQSTIEANQIDYPEITNNPYAYTLGIADIFEGKNIFLLAKGLSKSKIIFQSFRGKISPEIPASILQTHPNITAILDFDAASLLK